jgi:hypothetical protein
MDTVARKEGQKFKDFSFIPGINAQGVNKDSGFKVNGVNDDESIRRLNAHKWY